MCNFGRWKYTCDKDITWQLKGFHINVNLLLRKFGTCALKTKWLELFRSYCTNMYCGIFWHNDTNGSYQTACLIYNNSFRLS